MIQHVRPKAKAHRKTEERDPGLEQSWTWRVFCNRSSVASPESRNGASAARITVSKAADSGLDRKEYWKCEQLEWSGECALEEAHVVSLWSSSGAGAVS